MWFPTDTDRKLFQAALDGPTKVHMLDRLMMVYRGAVAATPGWQTIDCGDHRLSYNRGVLSPLVAILAGRRESQENEPGLLAASHVWLRTSMNANVMSDHSYEVASGRPGWGGSYKATVVGCPTELSYVSYVERPRQECYKLSPDMLAAWNAFSQQVHDGSLRL